MTETPEYRTKRIFCSYLKNYVWSYQYSVFYQSFSESRQAIEHGQAIRKLITREFPTQAFLWRLCLKVRHRDLLADKPKQFGKILIPMPYHTLLTNKKLITSVLEQYLAEKLDIEIRVVSRSLSAAKIDSYCKTVMRQEPHNLKAVLGETKINRFSLLNKKNLTQPHD